MNERDRLMINIYRSELIHNLMKIRRQPYLPHWGELYAALRGLRNIAENNRQEIAIFDISPIGQLVYCHENKKFTAKIPGLNVSMDLEECIDSLIAGRFPPKLRE